MTKNQLRMNVFVKTIIGRVIAALEWAILLALMASTVSYLLLPVIAIADYHEGQVPSFAYNGITFVCGFLGLLIGLNLKASLIMWRILPMNKKAAKRFIANKKNSLLKEINGRDALVNSLTDSLKIKITYIDEEMNEKKLLLAELTQFEKSL